MLASVDRGSLQRVPMTVQPSASPSPMVPPTLFDRLTGRARANRPDHAVVVLHDVTKRYPNGKEALKDVDVVVPEGDFVFLVGPSGAGTSWPPRGSS